MNVSCLRSHTFRLGTAHLSPADKKFGMLLMCLHNGWGASVDVVWPIAGNSSAFRNTDVSC